MLAGDGRKGSSHFPGIFPREGAHFPPLPQGARGKVGAVTENPCTKSAPGRHYYRDERSSLTPSERDRDVRLTLRTLLAYLDDTLEPAEIKRIGQKVAESDAAQELIARIKQVTRRRRLTTPPDGG